MLDELSDFGLKTTLLHTKSKITGDRTAYIKQKELEIDSHTSEKCIPALKHLFKSKVGFSLNIKNPQTLTEKIQWLKIYDSTPLKTRLADKYLVREYVKEKVGDKYLIPLLGAWDSFDEIDFSKLPEKFVLKTNHASGQNIVVKNKSLFDIAGAKAKFDKWLAECPQVYSFYELHYRDIPRKIIAEEYIEQVDGNLYDYKIHCFNGKAVFTEVIGNRNLELHTGMEAFYTREWEKMDMVDRTYPIYENSIECPRNWKKMLEMAEILAGGLCYVRVDLYNILQNDAVGDGILFGEMTFSPASGFYPFIGTHYNDKKFGELLKLPKEEFILGAKKII